MSPVYLATVNKNVEVLRLLVAAGADVSLGDKVSTTSFLRRRGFFFTSIEFLSTQLVSLYTTMLE